MKIAEDFSAIRKELERIEKEKAARLQEQPIDTETPRPYIFASDYADCAWVDAATVIIPEDFTI